MTTEPSEPTFIDDTSAARYEARVGDHLAAFVTYRRQPARITFIHTEVVPGFEGRGISSRLARHVLDEARSAGIAVRLLCPFITSYVQSHPEYQDLVVAREPSGR